MLIKTKGIVISQTKFSDSGIIVRIFTEELGIQAFFVRVPKGKRSKNKAALFQPLTMLDLVVKYSERKTMHHINEAELWYNYSSLNSDMKKRSILFFIDELLHKCLQEESHNKELFMWISNSLKWLDNSVGGYSNFHLVFMLQLTTFMGFFPTLAPNLNNPVFNLQEGEFSSNIPIHPNYISGAIAQEIISLCAINYEESNSLKLTKESRKKILDSLISYYKFHLPALGEFKSIEVLSVILS